ncbi:MAG: phage terminase large subunit, partial [Allosphingosinicella sp.]
TRGGGRLATSIGGTLTGRGGDIIIIDDPLKPDEAMSETTRNSVNEWFHSTLASRLNDKKRGSILTVMQRLHQFDLAGMLLESGEWEELSIPAIAVEEASIPLTRGRTYHRRTGTPLHAAREPIEELLRIKKTIGSVLFAAQYQQQPVPAEGNMVRAEWLLASDTAQAREGGGQIVQSWDTATKEGLLNDWSVCITALVRRQQVFLLDVWRRKVEFPALRKAAIALARDHRASVILIEDQASGTQLLQSLRNEQPRGVPIPIARKPEGDKKSRLAGVSAMIEAGRLLLPVEAPWLGEFRYELLAFPSSRHDDQVDALSQLLAWADRQQRFEGLSLAAPIIVTVEEPDYGYGYTSYDPWGLD